MACVLDAVANLSDTKGSTAREVLSYIRQSNISSKNLTVQVTRMHSHILSKIDIIFFYSKKSYYITDNRYFIRLFEQFTDTTVQVQRALKHALAAGLLRHRSGRYKALATLNPVPAPDSSVSKKPVSNDPKVEKKELNPEAQAPIDDAKSSRRTQERKYILITTFPP